jgi:parallel beta-helix repeat protein
MYYYRTWFWRDGSADQIALYGVKHFSVTGNVSINGGDGGIVIENCQYGTISGNSCEGNFGPGIIIDAASFININGNVCINNCRRTHNSYR